MKKVIKYCSLVLFSAFFMFLLASNPVDAVYDRSKNNASVSVSKNQVKITVQYQRGFSVEYATYQWCVLNTVGECGSYLGDPINYVDVGGDSSLSYIALGDASHADKNLTTYTFVVPKYDNDNPNGDRILANLSEHDYNADANDIAVVANVYYCAVRNQINDEYTSCSYYDNEHPNRQIKVDIDAREVINDRDYASKDIDNEGIKNAMSKIEDIVNNTVMPIIWIVLGLFLVVKGALLGVQIVKAADEPQVRQEKVGSLKWLVIGVAIAYASTFVVRVVVSYFEKAFN